MRFYLSAILLIILSASSSAWARVFVTFYDLDKNSDKPYLVVVSPETPPGQEIATLSSMQWLWSQLIHNKNLSIHALRRAQTVLSNSASETPQEKLKALHQALTALVDEEILFRFWSDERIKDSAVYAESPRMNGIRSSDPLNDGRTTVAFIFGKDGIVAHYSLMVASDGHPVNAEVDLKKMGLEEKIPARAMSHSIHLPNASQNQFAQLPLPDSTQRLSGEFRRYYNITPDQTPTSVLTAALLTQRQLLVHSYGIDLDAGMLQPEIQSVVDRLWIRTDPLRARLYSSPSRGYGFHEVARDGDKVFLIGDSQSYMQMIKRNEGQALDRINEITMMRGLFSDGPYRDSKRLGRQPFPKSQRNTRYLTDQLFPELSNELSDAISCRGELEY